MRALIFDPFAGISGDMVLGALTDLGLSADWLEGLVESLGLSATVVVERVDRSGIACGRVHFELPSEDRHRHLADILEIIGGSGLKPDVQERAAAVFRRLAEAEAAVHGVPVERVHFHEVGALDSILDVVGAVAGLDELGYDRFFVRPVAVGSGTVDMDHGRFPLPAPATAGLLRGLAVRETGWGEECTTPTGAALVAVLAEGPPPREVVYGRAGYGAGTRDPKGRPNCLRVIECAPVEGSVPVHVIQADLDDMSAEYAAAASAPLLEAGALDVVLVPVLMKKGRPGIRLEVLVPETVLGRVIETVFRETRTIGLRHWPVDRAVLAREEEVVKWRGQTVRRKRVRLPDGTTRAKPEHDDVVAAARALGLPAHEVHDRLDDV